METLLKYKDFLNENRKPIMKYYAFDWDDNILNMPTVIHMEKLDGEQWVPQDVSTEEFAKVRTLDNWRASENAYIEFRDIGSRGQTAFIEDAQNAISSGNFGPSWKKFLNCLTKGSIFAIITARGHEPDTIRKVVEYIIHNILTEEQRNEMAANLTAFQDMFVQNFDFLRDISIQTLISAYLDKCDFVGVSSPSFASKYPELMGKSGIKNPEIAKIKALDEFIDRINIYGKQIGGSVSIGFSDDDKKTVKTIEKHFGEISPLYDDITFSVYDTSNPKETVKNKI